MRRNRPEGLILVVDDDDDIKSVGLAAPILSSLQSPLRGDENKVQCFGTDKPLLQCTSHVHLPQQETGPASAETK